jgi:hypothetical protein
MRTLNILLASVAVVIGLLPTPLHGQSVLSYSGHPAGAVILDQEPIPSWAHQDRRLLFWVLPPISRPLTPADVVGDLEYTCPVQTSGHARLLPARVSLVDTRARKIVNTIPVKISARDEYDVPLRIRPGYYYEVRRPLKRGEGKPHIFSLHDFNDDGRALEFAFYYMESCNGPLTMLMGYSEQQDRVTTYEFSFNPAARGGHRVLGNGCIESRSGSRLRRCTGITLTSTTPAFVSSTIFGINPTASVSTEESVKLAVLASPQIPSSGLAYVATAAPSRQFAMSGREVGVSETGDARFWRLFAVRPLV